jgi:hypothetical protein
LATTRSGWQSIVDLSFCVFIVVVCGSVSLLTYPDASAPAHDAAGSGDGFFLNESRATPVWTAASQGRPQDLPGDNNDVDDSDDDDDDDDDAGALTGGAITLAADHGPARHLIEAPVARPSSLRRASWSLRGPPQVDQDELTCSPGRHSFDQRSRPSAWTATDSHHQPQNSSPDNRDVDDRDLDDDDDDDDDGNDESAGALAAASIDLTADHAEGQRVIEPDSGAHPPAGCEAHSLRGPPSPARADSASSLDHDIPIHTSPFFFATDWHCLRAPPQAISTPNHASRSRKGITTETRSQS